MIPVSLCLTTCNRATVLPATVDSLLSQTFSDFELIISDDCSTDHTEEICRDYQARDPRIRYFRNNRNLKMPGNLNAAIGRATGEYIANLHDGDVYRAERWPAAWSAASIIAVTEPLPFVPAMWTDLKERSGCPSCPAIAVMLSSPNLIPNCSRPNR